MNRTNDETVSLKKHAPSRVLILKNPEIGAEIDPSAMPFELEWSYGWNSEIGLMNISNNNYLRTTFFVREHVGIIFEYNMTDKSKTMKMLTGHCNQISSFDASLDGRWLVTADKGDKSMLIVWDSFLKIPIHTISSPSVDIPSRFAIVKFCSDSKRLITVSASDTIGGKQTIDVWDWKSGTRTRSIQIDRSSGPIVHLTSCRRNPNYFCLTTETRILFMILEESVNKLTITVPKQDPKQSKFKYTQSTYVTGFRQVVSASTGGLVTVWDDADYGARKIKNATITNNKTFLKNVKLDEHSITTIICHESIIVTGNANGGVFFYDASLRVLYHLNSFIDDPVTSIAMVLNASEKKTKICAREESKNLAQNQVDRSLSSHVLCNDDSQIGTDFTRQQEFEFDPFFISTKNCNIFYVNISENSYVQIFEKCGVEAITALDVHPEKPCVILGDTGGKLTVYDYQTKQTLITTNYATNTREAVNNSQITSIKYSYNGCFLCYGCADGSFWFVDPKYLSSTIKTPFKWNKNASSVRYITFSKSSNYVAYTDDLFGIYLYGILSTKEFSVKYYGCSEVHSGLIRNISIQETTANLIIYSVGADHTIVIHHFDKTQEEPMKFVKSMKTASWHEPQCMIKSFYTIRGKVNLIISGSDLRLTVWNENRCIRTTLGVNLDSPVKVLKESPLDRNILLFCTDTDIGLLRQPVDGNPYKNAAVLASGTKLIDFGISWNGKYLFTISENSTSMLMWSIHTSYLDKLAVAGGTGLNAYGPLLDGGKDGPEAKLLMEYFKTVQLSNSLNPETTVFSDLVDFCVVSFIMRAMGYYLSETELSNMMYEMYTRREEDLKHDTTLMSFEELVVLYINYRPQVKLKIGELRRAFDDLVRNDDLLADYGDGGILTRESFVHAMKTIGEKIDVQELRIIIHTLMKTAYHLSPDSSRNMDSIYTALPFTFTFAEILTDLLGFKAEAGAKALQE